MKVCGLTGGVGMGKSTAAGFLSRQGAQVVDTDELARELVRPGEPALAAIRQEFGASMLTAAGELDRAALARMVFADPAARRNLESILHPRIRERWLAQLATWRQENIPLAVVVIPLLFETQAEAEFDKVICAACSAATQEARLLSRGWPLDQIRQRIAAQMPADEKMARSHYVLWTEGSMEAHEQQLARILARL